MSISQLGNSRIIQTYYMLMTNLRHACKIILNLRYAYPSIPIKSEVYFLELECLDLKCCI